MKVIIKQRHNKNRIGIDAVNVYAPAKQIQTKEVLRMLWEKECNAWIMNPHILFVMMTMQKLKTMSAGLDSS